VSGERILTRGLSAPIDDTMEDTRKPVLLSQHAKQQLAFRGTTEQEIVQAVRMEPWSPAEAGRLECRKDFVFNAEWNNKHYATKQVRPIFVNEPGEIVVVTVYVYYF